MRIDATPWVREVLSRVDREAIAAVVPPDAVVGLTCDRKPDVYRRETYAATVRVGTRSARGTGRTPLSATIVAAHKMEAAE